MKTLSKFAEVYQEWEYVLVKYGQDDKNFPLKVILQNCLKKIGVEITGIKLIPHKGEPAVKLSTTNKGEILITRANTWQLAHGQTNTNKTIFTINL